jgi:hypothetical protein
MAEEKKKEDTHSYKGWLNSDSFWKRAVAVFGYNIVGYFIIIIIFLAIIFIPLIIISFVTGLASP